MSGIQHFCFCQRQWALIHIEQQWTDNFLTVSGSIIHSRAHTSLSEKRTDLIVVRGVHVYSSKLRLRGICDVVEYHRESDGIQLTGYSGLWSVLPIEYKRGHSKITNEDRLQVCAQAIALEEMLHCKIPIAYLYYHETRSREKIELGDTLRSEVFDCAQTMNQLFLEGKTPKIAPIKACKACSLRDICLPELNNCNTVKDYINASFDQDETVKEEIH